MRHLIICCTVSLLLARPTAAQTDGAPAERLSLAAATQLAVEQNRSLAAAELQVEKAEADLAASRTRRLPSFETTLQASQLVTPVSFAFPKGAFGEFPGIGPIPAVDTDVTTPRRLTVFASAQATQPLSQLFRINLNVRQRATNLDVEREHLRDQQMSVTNAVKRLYFAIVQSESGIAASEEAIALYRELDRTLDVRVAQKVSLRSDGLDVKARLAQEELTRLSRANALDSQKEQLNQLLGRDVRTAFETDGLAAVISEDVDLAAAERLAIEQRPDVREARLNLQQAELDHRVKKTERIPDVSIAASYSSNFNIDVLPRNFATVILQAKWEPFDWGRKGHELAAKDAAVNQARLAIRDTEDRAVIDVNSRYRKLSEARAMLSVADRSRAASREKLRVKTDQFQVQAALLSDVLHLRADVADSNDQYQQALAAFWTAKADFELAVGKGAR